MFKMFRVFSEQQITDIKQVIENLDWQDGKETAKGAAKDKKDNFQILQSTPGFEKLMPYIIEAHRAAAVRNYTYVKEIVDPRVASYKNGGQYDWHVDVALLAQKRTDLSFSIFLNGKDDYQGGEMEIELPGTKIKVKGNTGEMIVYPSGLLHKVNPVSSGERLVIVGWLTSHVKFQEQRERLHDMLIEIIRIREKLGANEVENLNRLYHQFVRDFSN